MRRSFKYRRVKILLLKLALPDVETKILKYHHEQKSIKLPFLIYVDFEFLLN